MYYKCITCIHWWSNIKQNYQQLLMEECRLSSFKSQYAFSYGLHNFAVFSIKFGYSLLMNMYYFIINRDSMDSMLSILYYLI